MKGGGKMPLINRHNLEITYCPENDPSMQYFGTCIYCRIEGDYSHDPIVAVEQFLDDYPKCSNPHYVPLIDDVDIMVRLYRDAESNGA